MGCSDVNNKMESRFSLRLDSADTYTHLSPWVFWTAMLERPGNSKSGKWDVRKENPLALTPYPSFSVTGPGWVLSGQGCSSPRSPEFWLSWALPSSACLSQGSLLPLMFARTKTGGSVERSTAPSTCGLWVVILGVPVGPQAQMSAGLLI